MAACSLAIVAAIQVLGLRLVTVTGESMAPGIRAGDLGITWMLGAHSAPVGSILLIERPTERALVLHRVVAVADGRRVTKGDASLGADAAPVTDPDVRGRLVALLPVSALRRLRTIPGDLARHVVAALVRAVGAGFSQRRSLAVDVASGAGAGAVVEATSTSGADAAGRLLPGATAAWSLLLEPCAGTGTGGCGDAAQQLRLDAGRFGSVISGIDRPLARSLRLETLCRDAAAPMSAATTASSLFTGEWSSTAAASGVLATLPAGGSAMRCEVRATLLGSVSAVNRSIVLPLTWGP